MDSERLLSLNEIDADFEVEDLEPRLEMQMLGLGYDPVIIRRPQGTITTIRYYNSQGRLTRTK